MTEKYVIERFSGEIKTIEVVRETEHTVWFKSRYGGTKHMRREARNHHLFDDRDEAITALLAMKLSEVKYASDRLESAERALAEVLAKYGEGA